ncbi:WxL domain-containing protein [Streptomyces sp. AP-93]|uniref:WxL domain-containing protein n=1 Tax=Streptomyces sp. AP-93 TaxID=2929048 RepID=UPI001FAE764C|nr:WxL domain-containing protein [Streptomyces sp. AP-93]MCJ0870728.1 WxL domain-containing protein [Streptomyces sp. AP-93]
MAVLAAATGGALSAPAAAEGETPSGQVEFPTHCLPPQEAGLPPADGPTTARITVDDSTPRVGDTVTVTYQVTRTPAVNPLSVGLPADVLTPTGRIVLGGVQQGEVTVVGAKRNDPVEAGGALPAVTMTGTFTVTAPGEITLAPGGYTLHTGHLLELDTVCAAASGSAAPGPDPAPSAKPSASASGSASAAPSPVSPSPSPSTVPVPAGPPVAQRITASPLPTANLRAVALGTAAGAPGARVKVTGAGFVPGAEVTVAGRTGTAQTADRVTAKADELGVVLAELAVTDRATTAVVAYEGEVWTPERGSGPSAYTVIAATPLPPGSQTITAVVEQGELGMTQEGDAVTLAAVPYGDGGAAAGRIGTVTVKDARGGPAGWSLIGKVTDFTGSGGVRIPGASLNWTPECAAAPGSPSACTPGSAGTVGPDGAVLASTGDAALVGGTFTVDAAVTLQVPPYTPPGAYTAVLTLTLS